MLSAEYDLEKYYNNNFYFHYQIRNITLTGFDIYFNVVSSEFSPILHWIAIS